MSKGQKIKREVALTRVMPLLKELARIYGEENVAIAGSVRRNCSMVGDVDIVIVGLPDRLPDAIDFTGGSVRRDTMCDDVQVNLVFTDRAGFGACLQYFTGSKAFNIKTRVKAKGMGLKLNNSGVFDGENKRIAGESEMDVFLAIGMFFVPPEDRSV